MEEITESISNEKMQFAVLIDADNISSKYAVTIFEELEKYGMTSYRRIYGNWSKGNGWFYYAGAAVLLYQREECHRYGNGH